MKVLVLDDEPEQANQWATRLDRVTGLDAACIEDLEALIATLTKRWEHLAKLSKTDCSRCTFSDLVEKTGYCEVDDADIVVVDCDLRRRFFMSGHEVIRLIRAYSSPSVLVGLNWLGPRVFDLSMTQLRDSPADLEIGDVDLASEWLWSTSRPKNNFAPWHWFQLNKEVSRLRRRIEWLLEDGRLDASIVETLQLTDGLSTMPRSRVSFIAMEQEFEKVTFREFVTYSATARTAKERKTIRQPPAWMVAQIAAARVLHWLERDVLGGQDVLIDAPHLAERAPEATTRPRKRSPGDLARHADRKAADGISGILKNYIYESTDWLHRRAWWWNRMLRDGFPASHSRSNLALERGDSVFCEDISLFLESRKARRFVCDIDTKYAIRHVSRDGFVADSVDYVPMNRLAR